MKNHYKSISVNCRCQIVKGIADENSVDIKLILQADSRIYDFGNNLSNLCIVSEDFSELKLLSNYILNYLHGSYVFIDIYTADSPYLCFIISRSYLEKYILRLKYLDETNFNDVMRLVSKEFITDLNIFSSKFLIFQKDYKSSVFKVLSLQSYNMQFTYDLMNFLEITLCGSANFKMQSLELKRIREIVNKIISELYKTSPTIQEMAKQAGMSISKFKILFEKEFGESPHQYILNKKLHLARELLQSGEYSIAQVSYKVGFNHASCLTRLFKHKFHYPPSKLLQ